MGMRGSHFGLMGGSLVCLLIFVVFLSASVSGSGNIKEGHLMTGEHMKEGTLHTQSAGRCQELCCREKGCQYFRWRNDDPYGEKQHRNRCYHLKAKGKLTIQSSWSWGPKCSKNMTPTDTQNTK